MPQTRLQILNDLMEQHALNVKKVADYAEVTTSCVYMWLRQERNIPKHRLNMVRNSVVQRNGVQMMLGDQWGVR